MKLFLKVKLFQEILEFKDDLESESEEEEEEKDDDDSDNSSKSSKSEKESEESEEEEEEEEGGSSPIKFNLKGNVTTLNYDKKKKTFVYSGSGWKATLMGAKKYSKYAIKNITNCNAMMVGFAPKTAKLTGNNYTNCGYYFYPYNGTKYSQLGSGVSFVSGCYNQNNNIISLKYDKKKGDITVYVSGKNLGVAYTGLKKLELFPCIDFCTANSQIQVVKFKAKK